MLLLPNIRKFLTTRVAGQVYPNNMGELAAKMTTLGRLIFTPPPLIQTLPSQIPMTLPIVKRKLSSIFFAVTRLVKMQASLLVWSKLRL